MTVTSQQLPSPAEIEPYKLADAISYAISYVETQLDNEREVHIEGCQRKLQKKVRVSAKINPIDPRLPEENWKDASRKKEYTWTNPIWPCKWENEQIEAKN